MQVKDLAGKLEELTNFCIGKYDAKILLVEYLLFLLKKNLII